MERGGGVITGRLADALPWIEVAIACAAVALSAPLYAGCFAGSAYLIPVLLAALVGGALTSLTRMRSWGRLRAAVTVSFGCLAYLAVTVLAPTMPSWHPTAATWTALHDGIIGGWLRLLTSGVPMDVTPTLLMTPVLISFWCGALAAAGCLLTRSPATPVGPALLAMVAGLLFGATLLPPSLTLTAGWLLLVLLVVLLRVNRFATTGLHITREAAAAVGLDLPAQQRSSLVGRLAFGVPVVVLVVGLGVLGAATLPIATGRHRFDPRSTVAQPIKVEQTLTPLATLQSQQTTTPPVTLFKVTGLTPRTDRLRVAALDTFDGATWTAGDQQFLPAGHQLPPVPVRPASGDEVTLKVTVAQAIGPFLPIVGSPTVLSGNGLGYSASGGVLVETAPLRPTAYTVTGLLPNYRTLTSGAVIGSSSDLRPDLALPKPPAALVTIAARITAKATTGYARALALAEYLRAQPYNLAARPGHSYGAITRMLARANPGDQDGFAEQHAAAFVVLARILGIPSRVAVGYLVDPKAVAAGGEVAITTKGAHAWAEVPIDGYGWVPFETLDLTKAPVAVAPAQMRTAPLLDRPGPINVSDGSPAGKGVSQSGAATLSRASWTGVLIVAALLLGPATVIIGEKRRRRWRRRAGATESARILGAWREAQDRLTERGVTAGRSASCAEVAEIAGRAVGARARAALDLAPLVSRALYAPDEPERAIADEAWELEGRLRKDLGAERSWPWRVTAWVDPRPLIRWEWPESWRRRRWASTQS